MSRTIRSCRRDWRRWMRSRMSGSAKTAQEIEIEALQARDKHLDGMAADRGC